MNNNLFVSIGEMNQHKKKFHGKNSNKQVDVIFFLLKIDKVEPHHLPQDSHL